MILAVISTLAAIFCIIYIIMLRRQIKDICRQVNFIGEHNSNKRISTNLRNREILELADCVNSLIDEKNRVKIQAESNERAFKDTIAGISHDIRTPLTSLDGYFQLMKNSSDSTLNEKYSAIISGRIHALQDMTEQLFTFVKLENPSYILECEAVNLTQTVCDVMFSFYDDIVNSGLEPNVSIPDEIFTVNANLAGIKRVLQNIIKNALVHGEKDLFVSMQPHGEDVQIAIGNKIAEDEEIDVTRVFDRFYKADASRNKGSTGLGLFIAKQLTERMGGQINAELTDGIFTIIIKLKRN